MSRADKDTPYIERIEDVGDFSIHSSFNDNFEGGCDHKNDENHVCEAVNFTGVEIPRFKLFIIKVLN